MTQPLEGLKVLDFSTLLPGPLATLMLAEAGAEVTKIERPGGEDMRSFLPTFGGTSAPFMLLNRGKMSKEIDLKTDEGLDAIKRLLATTDILVEQFRPGVMARLGLGFDVVKAINPGLIYCSISGYGQTGSRSGEAGHDLNYVARTGLLALSHGVRESPTLPPTQIADIGGGSMPAVINILLALIGRQRTGQGAYLDIAMADAMFTFALFAKATGIASGNYPANGGGFLTGASPRYGIYPAACGTPICVGALEDQFWAKFCDVIGLPEPDRDKNDATAKIGDLIGQRSAADWAPLFETADCCATPLVTLEDALTDPHFQERGLFDYEVGSEDGYLPAAVVPVDPAFRDKKRRKLAPGAARAR